MDDGRTYHTIYILWSQHVQIFPDVSFSLTVDYGQAQCCISGLYKKHAARSVSWMDTQPVQAACIVCSVWNKAIPFLWERRNLKQDYSVWHRDMRICWARQRNRCPLTCFSQQHHLLLHVLFSQGNKVPSMSTHKKTVLII